MSTPESKVKAFIDKWMKKWYPVHFKYSPPGVGRFGRNGMPDRLWFIPAINDFGVTVAIEAKDYGKEPTELQYRTLRSLKTMGLVASWVAGQDIDKMLLIKAEIDRRIELMRGRLV